MVQFFERFSFSAKLNQIDTAFEHLPGDTAAIADVDVTEINYAVETALVKRSHFLQLSSI